MRTLGGHQGVRLRPPHRLVRLLQLRAEGFHLGPGRRLPDLVLGACEISRQPRALHRGRLPRPRHLQVNLERPDPIPELHVELLNAPYLALGRDRALGGDGVRDARPVGAPVVRRLRRGSRRESLELEQLLLQAAQRRERGGGDRGVVLLRHTRHDLEVERGAMLRRLGPDLARARRDFGGSRVEIFSRALQLHALRVQRLAHRGVGLQHGGGLRALPLERLERVRHPLELNLRLAQSRPGVLQRGREHRVAGAVRPAHPGGRAPLQLELPPQRRVHRQEFLHPLLGVREHSAVLRGAALVRPERQLVFPQSAPGRCGPGRNNVAGQALRRTGGVGRERVGRVVVHARDGDGRYRIASPPVRGLRRSPHWTSRSLARL